MTTYLSITDNADLRRQVNVTIAEPIRLIVTDTVATPYFAEARILERATNPTLEPDTGLYEVYGFTALDQALTVADPIGRNPKLVVRLRDNGTPRAITWGSKYRGLGNALPLTTVNGKTLYLGFIYNHGDDKWDLIAKAQES